MIPPERLPDGRIDEVRFLVVSKHAAKGHRTAMNVCTQGACPQYREQYATIATLRAQLDDARRGRDAALIREKKPPVPWTTIRKDASDRGLYAVVDEAMIGRKLMPSRRRLIVGNIVMAVAEWRESFRDCGCWKTAEGFALCRWHEQAFQPQREEALGAALAALAALRAEVAGMEGPWNGMHEEMRVAVLAAIDRRLEP